MRRRSDLSAILPFLRFRLRLADFFVIMWLAYAFFLFIFPFLVTLNLFAAAFEVFIFGITFSSLICGTSCCRHEAPHPCSRTGVPVDQDNFADKVCGETELTKRRQYHHHVPPFKNGRPFDLGDFFHILDNANQDFPTPDSA